MNSSPLIFIRATGQDAEYFPRPRCGLMVISLSVSDSEYELAQQFSEEREVFRQRF